MPTTALKTSLLAFLAVYAIGGLATEVLLPGREKSAIPFFSWFLFAQVPNQMGVFAIKIHEYRGLPLDPPVFFEKASGIVSNPSSPKARELIQRIGERIDSGDRSTADDLRHRFEHGFLSAPTRYELIRLRYDPLERWRGIPPRMISVEFFSVAAP